jgi:TetR/AcrR family transcriptional regulator, tetracycline repressor protein
MTSTRKTPRDAGRPKGDQTVLNRAQIIAAALRVIDTAGLDGFTMRAVADELGVFHRAIYWHLPGGRNAVLSAVAAVVFEDVLPSEPDVTNWDAWLRALFCRYRAALRRHPNVAPLLGAQIVSNAGVDLLLVERTLQALDAGGFTGNRRIAAYNAVIAALLGFVTLELAPVPQDDGAWSEAFATRLQSLDRTLFPTLTAARVDMVNRAFIVRWQSGTEAPLDSGFEMYLDAFLIGLQHLAKRG